MDRNVEQEVNKYYGMVYCLALKKTGNYHDANDICQEVFLKYLENRDKFESEDHVKYWLLRVTVNTYLKNKTSGWNKNTVYLTKEIKEVLELSQEDFCYKDTYSFETGIDETIDALPEKYREVIKLFYYNEKSVREIAKLKNIGESAVKMQLFRGRKFLRDCMAG